MKLHRIVYWLAAMLLGAVASRAGAFNVTVSTYDSNGNPISSTTLSGDSTVNLDADSPVGGLVAYGPFTIARCSGCSGRARVFISQGSINKLVLTDAQITNRAGSPSARMTISVDSGPLSVAGPAGSYPYAVELNGSFVGTAATDPANSIQVKATTTAITSCVEGCFGTRSVIDSPALDPGETTDTTLYSVLAPPFSAGGVAVFAPKEQLTLDCSGWFVSSPTSDGGVDSCLPALGLSVNLSLRAGQAARLPGSIGAFHVASRCDPDSTDPALTKGCDIMANFFASLGPKGFKVYDVRLEPSPGGSNVDSRGGVDSFPDAWVTKRGASDDDDNSSVEGNISNTRARLQSGGIGDVKANGLCPAAGCPSSNTLPVRVYCSGQMVSETALRLNGKGDGKADLIFSLPCNDPAVLILDPSGQYWVAAPAIL